MAAASERAGSEGEGLLRGGWWFWNDVGTTVFTGIAGLARGDDIVDIIGATRNQGLYVLPDQRAITAATVCTSAFILPNPGLPLVLGVSARRCSAAVHIIFSQFEGACVAFGRRVSPRHSLGVATRAAFRPPSSFAVRLKFCKKFFFPAHPAHLHVGLIIESSEFSHRNEDNSRAWECIAERPPRVEDRSAFFSLPPA